MMSRTNHEHIARAVLPVLARGGRLRRLPSATGELSGLFGLYLSQSPLELPKRSLPEAEVEMLAAEELVALAGAEVRLTAAGAAWARRLGGGQEGFLRQHRIEGARAIDDAGASRPVRENVAESPLVWLWRRRGSGPGKPIGAVQFEAGMRLHSDFLHAGLARQGGMRWDMPSGSSRRGGGGRCGGSESDAMLDARARFRRALDAVGPELGDVLLDVCCLERGLEDVEKRRNWPQRAARVILDLALTRLARHYGLETTPACALERHAGALRYFRAGEGSQATSAATAPRAS